MSDDLIAMNALYRPGPMEYIPNFIKENMARRNTTFARNESIYPKLMA